MLAKNNGPGDSTPDAETDMTSPANSKGSILYLSTAMHQRKMIELDLMIS
jgi:hypothetical protein